MKMKEGTFVWGAVKLLSDDRNLGYGYGIYHKKGISIVVFRKKDLIKNTVKVFPVNFLKRELHYCIDIDPAYISLSDEEKFIPHLSTKLFPVLKSPIEFVEKLSSETLIIGDFIMRRISNRYRFIIYSHDNDIS